MTAAPAHGAPAPTHGSLQRRVAASVVVLLGVLAVAVPAVLAVRGASSTVPLIHGQLHPSTGGRMPELFDHRCQIIHHHHHQCHFPAPCPFHQLAQGLHHFSPGGQPFPGEQQVWRPRLCGRVNPLSLAR